MPFWINSKKIIKKLKKNPTLDADFEEFLKTFEHTKGDVVSGTNGAQKIRMARVQDTGFIISLFLVKKSIF